MPKVCCFDISTDSRSINTVCKILEIITGTSFTFEVPSFLEVYISCILATTLWCTVLIVIRVLIIIRGANGRLGDYSRLIEILFESSAIHSVTLIVFVALEARGDLASDCFDVLAAITTVCTDLLSFLNTYSSKTAYRESFLLSSQVV